MRDILKLGLIFLGIMAFVVVVGLVLDSCTGGEKSPKEDTPDEEEVMVTPTVVASNPLTVRGTAAIDMHIESISNAFYEAVAYELKPGQDKSQATPIGTATKEKINHQKQLPTQWDFRITIPNFNPENTYFVFGALYSTPQKLITLLEGDCANAQENKLCTVVGEGDLVNYWMELIPAE